MLQLAFFDFDLTLSTCHVFGNLSGRDNSLALQPPYAKTELGQVVLIGELDSNKFQDSGGFVTAAFGGKQRLASLRGLLTDLQTAGVECVVCTRGYVGPVHKLLHQSGLSGFFNFVYGELGSAYGTDDFDQLAPKLLIEDDARFLGESKNQLPGGKQPLIQQFMAARKLGAHEVLFLDDDPSEIMHVQGTCQTLQVSTKGLGSKEMHILRSLAGITPAEAALAAASSARGAAIQRQRSQQAKSSMPYPSSARGQIIEPDASKVGSGKRVACNPAPDDWTSNTGRAGSIRAPVATPQAAFNNLTPRQNFGSPQTPLPLPFGHPGAARPPALPFLGPHGRASPMAPPQVAPSLVQAFACDHRACAPPGHMAIRAPLNARPSSMFAPAMIPRW